MGQYHMPVSIEAAEGIMPHTVGCGLKTGEQLYTTPGTPHALLALVTVRSGNGPADCANSPVVGRWAGTRCLIQGDYAEDDDIKGWTGPALSQLYGAVGYHKPTIEETVEGWSNVNVNGASPGTDAHMAYVQRCFDEALANYDPAAPHFADISEMCAGFLEGAASVRYFGKLAWRSFVRVMPTAQKIAVGDWAPPVGAYVPWGGYTKEGFQYLERMGLTEADWSRVPRSGDWHGLLDSEVDNGQERVVVNLDTMEYLDPRTFGEVPTLGGMVRAEFGGVATALFAALVHPERRGGGDIPSTLEEIRECQDHQIGGDLKALAEADGYVGRWRGGHIVGTSTFDVGGTYPTTEEVRARGRDISRHAMAYLTAVKDW